MTDFTLYTSETAPNDEAAQELKKTEEKYGTTLNIFAHMAESGLPIRIYNFGQDQLMDNATLSPEEVNLVQLAVSVTNECRFCVAAHTNISRTKFKTDTSILNAVRNNETLPDGKLNTLVNFAQTMVEKRGQLSEQDKEQFLGSGFTKRQIFEVLSIVAYKTITNYTSNIAGTEPNNFLAEDTWSPSSSQKAA